MRHPAVDHFTNYAIVFSTRMLTGISGICRTSLLLSVLITIVSAPLIYGQALTGYVSGRILDSSGKLVSGAQVSLINTGTQQKRTTITSHGGDFLFPETLPGTFDLQVEFQGFGKYEQKGIIVAPSDHLVLEPDHAGARPGKQRQSRCKPSASDVGNREFRPFRTGGFPSVAGALPERQGLYGYPETASWRSRHRQCHEGSSR